MTTQSIIDAPSVLVAGGTGYLGHFIIQELLAEGFLVRAVVRDSSRSKITPHERLEILSAEVTNAATLAGCCDGMDYVFSSVGITRQKDGLSYMDVDYQANLNILTEAKRSGVGKFLYVSSLHGEKLRHLNICEAKEKFVDALKSSGMDYCVIRPSGFFSDMTEFLTMARKGRIYLFGDGSHQSTPIHGKDLAELCVTMLVETIKEIEVGGPKTLTQTEIAHRAFSAAGLPPKITYIPDWVRRLTLRLAKLFLSKTAFGPVEFFLTVMAMDMKAPEFGNHSLRAFYQKLQGDQN